MKAAAKPLDEDDIFANQNAISRSELHSSAHSLLQSMAGDDYSDDEEIPREENENEEDLRGFGDVSTGMGYNQPSPHDDSRSQTQEANAATEKLRTQMLGTRAKFHNTNHSTSPHLVSTKSRPRPAKRKDDSDDEQEGRSAVGQKRKQIPIDHIAESESQAVYQNGTEEKRVEVSASASVRTAAPSAKKTGGSYLDQLLAERAAKKRKKGNTDT